MKTSFKRHIFCAEFINQLLHTLKFITQQWVQSRMESLTEGFNIPVTQQKLQAVSDKF